MSFSASSFASFRSCARLPLSAVLVATALLASAPTTFAQDGAASAAPASKDLSAVKKSLEDFVHYVLIGKADLAQAAGEAALSADVTDADLATAVDEGGVDKGGVDKDGLGERLNKAISRSRAMGGVSDLATKIEDRVEDGRRALSRNPQRIGEAIGMLRGSLRERMIAEERLNAAGEYAVPQLLKVVVESKDTALELEATKRLVALKRHSVLPLSMALANLDSASQRKVIGMLGEIGYPHAIPFILEVGAASSAPDTVKAAADVAFKQLNGTAKDVSAQFTALARKFFDRDMTLVPNPTDAVNNLWAFDGTAGGYGGLQATSVATPVFCEEMAMTLARRALAADSSNNAALAIYVASDLRRENTLGSDAQPGRYSPQFFATAAGPSVCTEVLGMAIDSKDTALVRDAIAVLRQTAGSNVLVANAGRTPMLEALGYSDRRVRLDAALAIAGSLPKQSFAGDFSIVPTIVSAISDSGVSRATVLGGTLEDRQALQNQLGSAGFAVVAGADNFDALEVDVIKSNGVDLVVVRGTVADIQAAVTRIRASGATSASPVVAIANALEESAVRSAFANDRSVVVWTEGSTAESFRGAATLAMSNMSGSVMDEAEAVEYAVRSAEALRGIAFSGSKTLLISDAEGALLRALGTKQGGLRLMIAEVLALIATPAAQNALVDAAIGASGEEQVMLCDYAALAARTSGGKADERQLAALRQLIGSSEGTTADAAGRLYGSLNAGSAEAVKLITR
jgi:hypothetical protein